MRQSLMPVAQRPRPVPGQRVARAWDGRSSRPASDPRGGADPDADTLLRLGEHALYVTGSLTESRQYFRAAFVAADRAGRPEAMARAALGLGGMWVAEHRSAVAAAEVQMRQMDALQRLDPGLGLARRLSARLAAEEDYRCGRHAGIVAAMQAAAARNDPIAHAEAISLAHHCLLGPDHLQRRLDLAGQLLRIATRTGRRFDTLLGLYWRTVDLLLAADPHAGRSLAELRDALGETGHLALDYAASGMDVALAIRAGRLDEAELAAERSAAVGAAAGDLDVTGWHGAQLVAIRWYQGRVGELVPLLGDIVDSPTLSEVDDAYPAALAVAAAAAGDQRQAARALAGLGSRLTTLARSSSWLVCLAGVVEAADALAERDIAGTAYDLLLPFADLPMMASLGVACFGSTQHALGVASLTLNQADRAIAHLRAAVQANRALGHAPAAVLSRHRLVQALRIRARPEDDETATELAEAVRDEADRLGMALPVPPTGVVRGGSPAALRLRRSGNRWLMSSGSLVAEVADGVGMRYLAALVDRPGVEIPAIDLVATPATVGGPPGTKSADARLGNGGRTAAGIAAGIDPGCGGALAAGRPGTMLTRQPVLDRTAAAAYRARLMALDEEIADAEAGNDIDRLARRRDEKRWLLAELGRAAGLGGRARVFPDDAERARSAVAKAIRRAVDRVAREEPALADELRRRLHTGQSCHFDAR